MKQLFTVFCFIILFLAACKKETGENQNLDPKDQRKYDLMTNKEGSWWLYGTSDGTICRLVATGRDSTVKDLFFSYYERIDTTSVYNTITPEFFGKNADRYVTLIGVDDSFTTWVTVVFFKDNAAVNDTWVNVDNIDYAGFQFDMKVESKILSMNEAMNLNGRGYDSVIRIHHDFYARANIVGLPSDYTGVGFLDVWFVKGIGIIKKTMNLDLPVENFKKAYSDSLLDYYFVPE